MSRSRRRSAAPRTSSTTTSTRPTRDLRIFNTETWLDDIYYQYTPNGNLTNVSEVGETSFLDLGAIDQTFFKTLYGKGNGLIDVIPEPSHTGQAVPIVPANNAALTHVERDPDGQVTQHTTNGDGSYTETATYPDGSSAVAQVNSNGTGSYSLPLGGASPELDGPSRDRRRAG